MYLNSGWGLSDYDELAFFRSEPEESAKLFDNNSFDTHFSQTGRPDVGIVTTGSQVGADPLEEFSSNSWNLLSRCMRTSSMSGIHYLLEFDLPLLLPTANTSHLFETAMRLHSNGKPSKLTLSDTRTLTSWLVLTSCNHWHVS
jgi:hypothetical protein